MIPEQAVWIFMAVGGQFPGGVFSSYERAAEWIVVNKLSGTLTAYPLDQGAFDWALSNGMTNLRSELIDKRRYDPVFVGRSSTASQEHFHYEGGHLA